MSNNERYNTADGVTQNLQNTINKDEIQHYLLVQVERTTDITAHCGATTGHRSHVKQSTSLICFPDGTIISLAVDKGRKALLPKSLTITWSFKVPPEISIDATGKEDSRNKDIGAKPEEYASCAVLQYIRFDRDIPHSSIYEKVIVGTLRTGTRNGYYYEDEIFCGDEEIKVSSSLRKMAPQFT